MIKIAFIWVFALNFVQAQSFTIKWCSASEIAKNNLNTSLNKLQKPEDTKSINRVFAHWAQIYSPTNPSNIIAVVQRGNRFYRWPLSEVLFTNRPGIVATRSLTRPTIEEIACFFQDTLIIVDTLRFTTGRSANVRFSLKIDKREYPLPYDNNTSEVLICSAALPGIESGKYHNASMWVSISKDTQEQAIGKLYLLSPNEKQVLFNVLQNQRIKVTDCDDFLYTASAFMYAFWGGKRCIDSSAYDSAQYEILRKLTECLK